VYKHVAKYAALGSIPNFLRAISHRLLIHSLKVLSWVTESKISVINKSFEEPLRMCIFVVSGVLSGLLFTTITPEENISIRFQNFRNTNCLDGENCSSKLGGVNLKY
jgi:hypothetical protein